MKKKASKRWSWRKKTKSISLYFDTREIAIFGWFPPWQSDLMKENADYMVRVLNAAFSLGENAADLIEAMAAKREKP